jgi:hypothetical protein
VGAAITEAGYNLVPFSYLVFYGSLKVGEGFAVFGGELLGGLYTPYVSEGRLMADVIGGVNLFGCVEVAPVGRISPLSPGAPPPCSLQPTYLYPPIPRTLPTRAVAPIVAKVARTLQLPGPRRSPDLMAVGHPRRGRAKRDGEETLPEISGP